MGLSPPRFCAQTGHTGSGMKTNPGEDQAGLSALTTVVRQGPVSTGQHSACGFRAKTGPSGLSLKTDPGIDQAGLSTPSYSCQAMSSHPRGIPAVERRALPSLPALERGVPIGLSLLQTASSQTGT